MSLLGRPDGVQLLGELAGVQVLQVALHRGTRVLGGQSGVQHPMHRYVNSLPVTPT